jgi:hypothetical protein
MRSYIFVVVLGFCGLAVGRENYQLISHQYETELVGLSTQPCPFPHKAAKWAAFRTSDAISDKVCWFKRAGHVVLRLEKRESTFEYNASDFELATLPHKLKYSPREH